MQYLSTIDVNTLVLIALCVLGVWTLVRLRIHARTVATYKTFIERISEGDLTGRLTEFPSGSLGGFGRALNAMTEKLQELDLVKSSFNSVAAHQLRTPLSGMKWVLKYLLDGDAGKLTPEQQEMVRRGLETNEKMIQMVNNLLYVSRIENGKFGYEFKEYVFANLIKALKENSELAFKERGVQLSLSNDVPPELAFVFDFNNLLITLQNLVDNAIKYTPAGGTVSLDATLKGADVVITVRDTGIGIPRDEVPQLFSKFFRASNAVHFQTEGTGLGLFIAKTIVLRHGGTITVDSQEGEGTTFTLTIPTTRTNP